MNRRLGLSIGAFCVLASFTLMDAGGEAQAGLFRRGGGYYSSGYGGCCGCSGRHRHHRHHRRRGCCGTSYVNSCCGTVNYCGTSACGAGGCGVGGCGTGACGTPGCGTVAPYGAPGANAPVPMDAPPPAPEAASPSDTPPETAPAAPARPNAG
ncbi:MAG TPA: hypothetical protein VHC19_18775 [Pirellulales bacterium]|nr:hypothetical protein [Pirellulales bacterium]